MAFVAQTPDNQQNINAPTGPTTSNPATQTPPQAGGSAGSAGGNVGKSPNVGSSTSFGAPTSKLGDYLTANAPQVQQQGQNIANQLNTQYGQVQGDIANAANQFGQQVSQGYAAPNQDVVNNALSNPTKFVKNPSQVSAFQGQLNDVYGGPANFESTDPYSKVQGDVSKAVTNANLLGTPGGLQSYFQGNEPNATQGVANLNSLLLQMNPQANQAVQAAAKPFGTLADQLGTATTGANQGVIAAQKAAQDASQYAQGQFNPYVQNFNNTIGQGASNAEAQREAYNTAIGNASSQLTPVEQAINQWAGTTYGAPNIQDIFQPVLSNLNPVNTPITDANYATPEQYAEAAALQQLGGQGVQTPLNQADISQAGTAPTNPAGAPDLHALLGQDFPAIRDAEKTSFNLAKQSPGNTGDVLAKNVQQQYTDLINYLNSVDPKFAQYYGG